MNFVLKRAKAAMFSILNKEIAQCAQLDRRDFCLSDSAAYSKQRCEYVFWVKDDLPELTNTAAMPA